MFDEVVIARPCAFRCIDRRVVQSQTTLEIEGRDLMRSMKIKLGVVCAAGCLVALTSAMWASGAGAAGVVGSGTASATKSVCGAGTGKKATGKPIKIGGIDMLIPGVDFTTIGKFAAAYFKCVNDNGGINGRPIKYILYNEQLNPTQEASLARKLVESDKVVGIVGNTSFAECGTNWKYYQSKGFTVIGAGVQAECFGTPPIAESNMGPRYSNIGAAQALVKLGAKSLVVASPDTISAYADGGVALVAKAAGIPSHIFPIKLPITDANSTILQLVQAAGDGGGVILDFTPDSAPALMQAAISQGLVDKVLWGSSTPIANAAMAKQFPQFDGKMHIDQEFGNINDGTPDENLYLADHEEVRAQHLAAGVRSDGLHGREVRDPGPDEREGSGHRRVVQRSSEGPQERQDQHALQAVVLRRQPQVPHPEQRGHHRHVQGRRGRDGERVRREDAVLPDPGCRPAARADAQVGEAVQPEHGGNK